MTAMLTATRLRELLLYDPATGVFTRRVRTAQMNRAGDVAGTVGRNGYVHMSVDGKNYYAHRLAVLYVTGTWPPDQVDHIDHDRQNNRWHNLRSASKSLNQQNIVRAQKNNKSGFLGVQRFGKKWRARIMHDGVSATVGIFETPDESHAAYVEAKRLLHPGCTL